MSVAQPIAGEVFSLRVYKNLEARPDLKWANSYEFRLLPGTTIVASTLENIVSAITSWELAFHLNRVVFDRAVVSTWVPDGQPYTPTSFQSIPLGGAKGARQADLLNTDIAPLQLCLLGRASVAFGRNGRRLYRGVLVEGDFTSVAGEAVLTTSGLADIVSKMQVGGQNIAQLVEGEGAELVMKGSSGADVVRVVNGISPAGVVVKQLNNRYFDRA